MKYDAAYIPRPSKNMLQSSSFKSFHIYAPLNQSEDFTTTSSLLLDII